MYMVQSRINHTIQYPETKEIHPDDHNLESSTYSINGGGRDVVIALGRARHEHDDKGVVYYPMYLVDDNKTAGKIGFIEFPVDKIASVIDDDGDVDADAIGEPLMCDFANSDYVSSLITVPSEPIQVIEVVMPSIFDVEEEVSETKAKDPDAIFEFDMNKKQPLTLIEEDKHIADDLRTDYIESPKNEWIERFMKNNKYAIHPSSDCIFSVIRDAFEQIGQQTTTEKLREVLANEITDDIYQKYRSAYLTIENEIHEGERQLKTFQSSLKELRKRVKKASDKAEHETIVKHAKELDAKSKSIKQQNEMYRLVSKQQFGFVADLDTFAKFQDCLRTTGCCVDKWAFRFLERKLNIKFILLSETAFSEDSHDSVLECGTVDESRTPNFYIIVSYKNSKYRLVSYMNKRILTYREIPYDIRMLIITRCKEHNSTGFNLIQDFRNLKTKFGAPLDYANQFENDVVFQFYDKAHNSPFPGTGSGETIPIDQFHRYMDLYKINNWRRKLDDNWTQSPFMLDNKKWASVEHYYQGSKYKKGFPDYYAKFSLDTEGDLSKDPYLAKRAGGKHPHDLKPLGAAIDPDFYNGRNLEERDLAIKNKFEQNLDLLQLLSATGSSTLNRFRRGNKAEESTFLVKLRKDLCI
jgi:predicted NAD-dependent protein-ADP-ribosyltransferase YbiA (DUF1768 family)